MPNLPIPDGIPREKFLAAIRSLGIDTKGLVAMTTSPHTVTVEFYARNDEGRILTNGHDLLTHRVTVPILSSGRTPIPYKGDDVHAEGTIGLMDTDEITNGLGEPVGTERVLSPRQTAAHERLTQSLKRDPEGGRF